MNIWSNSLRIAIVRGYVYFWPFFSVLSEGTDLVSVLVSFFLVLIQLKMAEAVSGVELNVAYRNLGVTVHDKIDLGMEELE